MNPTKIKDVTASHLKAALGMLVVFRTQGCETSLFWEVEKGWTLELTKTPDGPCYGRLVVVGVGVAFMGQYTCIDKDAEIDAFIAQIRVTEASR